MQISNNQTNLNFNGAFKIKPSELKAQTEIPSATLPQSREMSPCSALTRSHTEASLGEYHCDTR